MTLAKILTAWSLTMGGVVAIIVILWRWAFR